MILGFTVSIFIEVVRIAIRFLVQSGSLYVASLFSWAVS